MNLEASPMTTKTRGPMPSAGTLPQFTLHPDEAAMLAKLAADLCEKAPSPRTPGFFDEYWSAVGELPRGLREFLEDFRRSEPAGACLVRGFPVDDAAIGPTPGHWRQTEPGQDGTAVLECSLALCGLALGEPFAWQTLQAGRMIQDILPIPGDEARQSGYGSSAALEFHTEDGFHPNRCDYLLLLGLRNHGGVPTTIASVHDIRLPERTRAVLCQQRFCIVPDDEHIRQLAASRPDHPALAVMLRMKDDPQPTAVLSGRDGLAYLRIDRPFMYCADGDPGAEQALEELMAELERVQQDVVVGPGSLLVVDNYVAVHGRRSFPARYDGTDRWLKKITVSRNLRKGLTVPGDSSPRVIA
jgi:L-asparagine oxygenase